MPLRQAILDILNDAIVVLDSSGKLVFANQTACQLAEADHSTLLGISAIQVPLLQRVLAEVKTRQGCFANIISGRCCEISLPVSSGQRVPLTVLLRGFAADGQKYVLFLFKNPLAQSTPGAAAGDLNFTLPLAAAVGSATPELNNPLPVAQSGGATAVDKTPWPPELRTPPTDTRNGASQVATAAERARESALPSPRDHAVKAGPEMRVAPRPDTPDHTPAAKAGAGRRHRILVADDDDMVRVIIRSVLTQRGFDVVEAVDGEDAVQKCLHAEGTLDLMVIDMNMPRLSGREAIERLKAHYPRLRAILLSGSVDSTVLGASAGALAGVAHLQKPFDNEELVKLVQATLGWHPL